MWEYLTLPQLKGVEDGVLSKKVTTAQRLILVTFLVTFAYLIYYFSQNIAILTYTSIIDLIGYTSCFLLLKKGHMQTSRNLFATILNIDLFYSTLFMGVSSGNQYLYFPIAAGSFIFFHSTEPKRQLLFACIPIILLSILETVPFHLEYLVNISKDELYLNNKINLIVSLLLTIYCVYYAMKLFTKASGKVDDQNASLLTLIENMGNSIWQINTRYELEVQNSQFKNQLQKVLGITLSKGDNLLNICDDYEKLKKGTILNWKTLYDRCLKGEVFNYETSHTIDNAIIYKEMSFSPIEISGKITGAIINSKDITQRKEQENLLQLSLEENKTLAMVASTTSYAVMITNKSGLLDWVNSGFEMITGFSQNQVKDKTLNEILFGELTDKTTINEFETRLAHKKPFTCEMVNYKKNGEPFWMHFSVSPQYDDFHSVKKYIFIGMDVTDQKQSEEQLQMLLQHSQKLNKQLQTRDEDLQKSIQELNNQSWELQLSEEKLKKQKIDLENLNNELILKAQQLSEQNSKVRNKNFEIENSSKKLSLKAEQLEQSSRYKSEFLANMSHELRTPLNSIIILSRLLAENKETTLTSKQQEFARVVNKSGSDLLILINDILDLSKIEAGKIEIEIEEFSIKDIADDLESIFNQLAIEKELSFQIILNTLPHQKIKSDHLRLAQVLKNLLSNAFKFTPKKGTVELVISNEINNNISFKVIDTGIGIPLEKHNLIFESFKQVDGSTSRKYGGTGLGLSISRELTVLLGGQIALNSNPGKGSVFSIVMPSGFELNESNPSTEESTAQKTLLIIEDDEIFSKMLERFALNQGFKPIVCNRGDSGFMRIVELKPSGILLDMNLPGMDGRSILKKLKSDPELSKIPVHVISSSLQENKKEDPSIISWLQKPVNSNQLNKVFDSIKSQSNKFKSKVLVIEDSPEQSKIIRHLLKRQNVNCVVAETGEEALKYSAAEEFDCIILDLNLPDSNGLDILKLVKENSRLTQIPVIVYSSRELTDADKKFLKAYASSYVHKSAEAFDQLMEETEMFLQSVKEQKNRVNIISNTANSAFNFKGKKVLIVDDDQRNIYAITSMLENYDLTLIAVSNGKEAINELNENPDINLVLMDIMMPEMNGLEATQQIRTQERFKQLPIIALTAKAMKDDFQNSIDAGMNDHVTKPIDSVKLLQLMNSYFQ